MRLGVVLAGGRSSRMGENKALLPWNGRRLVDIQVEVLQNALDGGAVRVSGELEGVSCIADRSPGLGPLAGIEAALVFALERKEVVYSEILFLPVDLPLMTETDIRALLEVQEFEDGIRFEGQELPIRLRITPTVVSEIRELLSPHQEAPFRSLRELIRRLRFLEIPVRDSRSFLNMNTPESRQEAWVEYQARF